MKPTQPSVLAIKGGSSSIRFALYEEGEPLRRLLDEKMDRIGLAGTNLTFKDSTGTPQGNRAINTGNHRSAVAFLSDWLETHLDRFHLVADVIDRVPQLGTRAAYVKQAIRDKLIEHKHYIAEYGEDMPAIRNWQWGAKK